VVAEVRDGIQLCDSPAASSGRYDAASGFGGITLTGELRQQRKAKI